MEDPIDPELKIALSNIENCKFPEEYKAMFAKDPNSALYRKKKYMQLSLGRKLAEIPQQAFTCNHIRILNLRDMKLLTTIPKEIVQFTNLQKLIINGCNFAKEFPVVIFDVISLKTIWMSECGLSKIPPEIKKLTNLESLLAEDNEIEVVGPEICTLTKLRKLQLGESQIVTLPEEIGSLVSLELLDLRMNKISVLPVGISKLTSLKKLLLAKNPLVSIPGAYYKLDRTLITLPEDIITKFNYTREAKTCFWTEETKVLLRLADPTVFKWTKWEAGTFSYIPSNGTEYKVELSSGEKQTWNVKRRPVGKMWCEGYETESSPWKINNENILDLLGTENQVLFSLQVSSGGLVSLVQAGECQCIFDTFQRED